MSLEVLGARALAPYFGSGIYVWGAVISVFMISLSLGYLIGGTYSARAPSTGKLCLILGLAATCALPSAMWSTPILTLVFNYIADPRYGALAATILLFLLPITMLGAIGPYAVRLCIDNLETSGSATGRVLFVSTVGSTAGTLITSFYLVLYFEMDDILMTMIWFSIAVAGAIALLKVQKNP